MQVLVCVMAVWMHTAFFVQGRTEAAGSIRAADARMAMVTGSRSQADPGTGAASLSEPLSKYLNFHLLGSLHPFFRRRGRTLFIYQQPPKCNSPILRICDPVTRSPTLGRPFRIREVVEAIGGKRLVSHMDRFAAYMGINTDCDNHCEISKCTDGNGFVFIRKHKTMRPHACYLKGSSISGFQRMEHPSLRLRCTIE